MLIDHPRQASDAGFPTLRSIYAAQKAIRGLAIRTPLVPSSAFSRAGLDVRFKLETAQPIGAFKIRGAANAVANLTTEERRRGVVCASTGNHGRAVSLAASSASVAATVCMSALVPQNKIKAIRALGATVVISGISQDDAQSEAGRLTKEFGLVEIPPFDHPAVIAGQGTIALEILEDFPDVDTILVPLSGGGLISGVALAAKSADRNIRIIGVGTERCPAMRASLLAGLPVDVAENESLADSLGGGIGLANRYTFELTRRFVDETISVSELQIMQAMRALFAGEGWVCEGAGAVGVIPLMDPSLVSIGKRVAVVLSGRNIDMDAFARICA